MGEILKKEKKENKHTPADRQGGHFSMPGDVRDPSSSIPV